MLDLMKYNHDGFILLPQVLGEANIGFDDFNKGDFD